MLFEQRLQRGLSDGSIRLAFRRWKRSQVVAGRRYRSPIGMIEVQSVSVVSGDIPDADARLAGYASVQALLADLKGPADGMLLYRIEMVRSQVTDQRDELAHADKLSAVEVAELQRRLARLDAAWSRPWTAATLRAIEAAPGKRAAELAVELGWPELHEFKLHVRKLKALGLTLSLRVGYELAPRGLAYLATVE